MPRKAEGNDPRQFFAAVAAHGSARVLAKVASAPLERIRICLQVGQPPLRGVGAPIAARGTVATVRDIVVTQGTRALWRGCGTHIVGVCIGGVVRLRVLRTSQMWAMPGGDQHYTGLGAYARRCAFLYAAGAAALLVAYPLDVAYTCLAADGSSPRRFRGFFHLVRHTRREHGFSGLYRGLPLCLCSAVPFVLISTAVHDLLAPRLLQSRGHPSSSAVEPREVKPEDLSWLVREAVPAHLYPWNLLVGASSGFVAQAATYPLDTLRRRWQHTCVGPREGAPRTFRECVAPLFASGTCGWRQLYAGFGVNALKLIPEVAVLSGVYLFINASGRVV